MTRTSRTMDGGGMRPGKLSRDATGEVGRGHRSRAPLAGDHFPYYCYDDAGARGALSAAAVGLRTPGPPSDDVHPPFVLSAPFPWRLWPIPVSSRPVDEREKDAVSNITWWDGISHYKSLVSLLLSQAHDALSPTPPRATARKIIPAVPPLPPEHTSTLSSGR
jgi:hypothetical protein